MPVEILSFDLDDTLWPCAPTILRAEQALFEWMSEAVPDITRHHTQESLRRQRLEFVARNPQISHDLTRVRVESMRALSRQHGTADDWVEEAFEVFYEMRQQVSLFDDVAGVMDELQRRYRLIAVSNGNADIGKTGVGHWFEFSVSAGEAGVAKPHPGFFETVITRAGADPGRIIHIGDDPRHDILGASAAGLATVWVNRHGAAWPLETCSADSEISGFEELPAAIRRIEDSLA